MTSYHHSAHDHMYSIHVCDKVFSDLQQVSGFLRVLWFNTLKKPNYNLYIQLWGSSVVVGFIPMQWLPITTPTKARCTLYSIQPYVIKFVCDLHQVGGFLRVLWFPPPIKRTPWYNWNIVDRGIKHNNPK